MLGFAQIVLQTGAGEYQPSESNIDGVNIEHFQYKPSIKDNIEAADLVISHAGELYMLQLYYKIRSKLKLNCSERGRD